MPKSERTAYLSGVLPGLPRKQARLLTATKLDAVAKAGWTESFEEVDQWIWAPPPRYRCPVR